MFRKSAEAVDATAWQWYGNGGKGLPVDEVGTLEHDDARNMGDSDGSTTIAVVRFSFRACVALSDEEEVVSAATANGRRGRGIVSALE